MREIARKIAPVRRRLPRRLDRLPCSPCLRACHSVNQQKCPTSPRTPQCTGGDAQNRGRRECGLSSCACGHGSLVSMAEVSSGDLTRLLQLGTIRLFRAAENTQQPAARKVNEFVCTVCRRALSRIRGVLTPCSWESSEPANNGACCSQRA